MEILPGIHQIPRIKGPHAYLLEGDDLTLIDTGWPGNGGVILSYIKALGWQTGQLARILITHGHPDHTGSARFLREETGAQVLIHAAETRLDRRGVQVVRHVGMLFMPLPSIWRVPVDVVLSDGDTLPIMGGLRVVHAPGHTLGSICFYLEDRSTLFTGDLVSQRGPYIARPIYMPGTDYETLDRSLRRVAGMPLNHACLSHGDRVLFQAAETMSNVARWHAESPRWMRWLQTVPRFARLGIEPGYRME